MNTVGIFYNPRSFSGDDYCNKRVKQLQQFGFSVVLLQEQYRPGIHNVTYVDHFTAAHISLLMVFGGDGTLLMAAKKVISEHIPILGFNLGKLGFLSECRKNEFIEAINLIKKKQFVIESRMAFSCYFKHDPHTIYTAINDCVVFRGRYPKLINIDVYRNDEFVYTALADGVVVSTPIGSTAYSLSAGGPIIHPRTQVITVTPLNSHNIFLRPIVLPGDSLLQLVLRSNVSGVYLNVDGFDVKEFSGNDHLIVEASPHQVQFVKFEGRTFCSILRDKFQLEKK